MQTLTSVSAPYGSATVVQPIAQPLRIVALGDSMIYGFGDPEGGGWVERLRRHWMSLDSAGDAAGHVLYNLGVRGDGVRQVAQRLEQEFRYRGELRHRVPDAIVLSVGMNDSARLGHRNGRNSRLFEDFQRDLADLLDCAQGLCSVYFVGMTPVDEAKMPFANCLYYSHADQRTYNEATRLACLERQIPYLDVLDQWLDRGEQWWRSHLSGDGLHPNSAGYAALLQDFLTWEAVRPWMATLNAPA